MPKPLLPPVGWAILADLQRRLPKTQTKERRQHYRNAMVRVALALSTPLMTSGQNLYAALKLAAVLPTTTDAAYSITIARVLDAVRNGEASDA